MSCPHLRRLATLGEFRYIDSCPCNGGIVHLSWDVATLHLSLKDFAWLAAVVEEAAGRESPDLPLVLWVGSVALRMSRTEGLELQGMIRAALAEMMPKQPEPTQIGPFTRLLN
ncbi:hypothetical protein [Calidithermus timidus]|jgi:hypothetical protein|uniref:hypothetical protein n=1 Tax=Calidithermus timidus TaxID=307124 RepID=UPI000366181A|nr:hypothetical protein [Calidithermus timidus]